MGYAAFMSVRNDRDQQITLLVHSINCMYNNGDQGSNLNVFNNAVVQPHQTFPVNGPQYIEADASGGCFFQSSFFTLRINDAEVTITDDGDAYAIDYNDDPNTIAINISNDRPQAHISVVAH